MTGSQKVIKVVSILVIIVAILSILLGLASCVGGFAGVAASSGVSESEQETLALGAGLLFFLGGGAIISGVIDLIVGMLGVRGANNPEKIMPFFVISIIAVVFAVFNLIGCFTTGQMDATTIASAVVQLVLMVVCVVLANNVRNLRNRIYDQGFRQQQRYCASRHRMKAVSSFRCPKTAGYPRPSC